MKWVEKYRFFGSVQPQQGDVDTSLTSNDDPTTDFFFNPIHHDKRLSHRALISHTANIHLPPLRKGSAGSAGLPNSIEDSQGRPGSFHYAIDPLLASASASQRPSIQYRPLPPPALIQRSTQDPSTTENMFNQSRRGTQASVDVPSKKSSMLDMSKGRGGAGGEKRRGSFMAFPHHGSNGNNPPMPKSTFQKIERPAHTTYERIVYMLDILVPPDEPADMEVPHGHFLQKVIVGPKWRWRVAKDVNVSLPEYLTGHLDKPTTYRVWLERKRLIPLLDPNSRFLRRWDALAMLMLLFTASVTPFETAFVSNDGVVDLLFLINRLVDCIFAIDLFVQMRTPYRDPNTGRFVSDARTILIHYLTTWFPVDFISVLPLELINFANQQDHTSTATTTDTVVKSSLSELKLLRFFRLMRLLKLLRILRASRKLRQFQATINLRYATLQIIQYSIFIMFIIHWLACGFRLAADKNDPLDSPGWTEHYADSKNKTVTEVAMWEIYMLSLYWSSSTVSLVGPNMPSVQPSNTREFGYELFASFVAYMNAVYFIAIISDVLSVSSKQSRDNDLQVDKYMEMFDKLKLDPRLKIKVHNYLSEKFALDENSSYTRLLTYLPQQLHGFISMEIFLEFVEQVPFLEVFIDREPTLIQELCRTVEIRSYPPNSHMFSEGYEGIYFIERGLCAMEGVIYSTGMVFGRSVLREHNKPSECRALTTVTVHLLTRAALLANLEKYPKILYYAKRWTSWAVLRRYILGYSKLYYMAARRGARFNPPLLTKRPFLQENEFDEIDLAVIEHMNENGF
ncbi:hypothetical protein HDU97_009992 [Phlyctochytrium planicorne]|nr:hypothetical protein HDU97_009992 [Phlyctochytrium planicorne]